MPAPALLVNGGTPRPAGTEMQSTIALDGSAVWSLSSLVGIASIRYSVVAPPGSTAAFTSETPTSPFTSELGPLDVAGTYLVTATANGDPASVTQTAVTVLAPNGLRIPGLTEEYQWDAQYSFFPAYQAAILAINPSGQPPATDSNHTHDWSMSEAGGAFIDAISGANLTISGTANTDYYRNASKPFAALAGLRMLTAGGSQKAITANGTLTNPLGGLTLECSVFAPFPISAAGGLVYIGSNSGSPSYIVLGVSVAGNVFFGIAQNGSTSFTSTGVPLPIGRNVRILLSYDRSAQTCKLYVDGVEEESANSGDGIPQLANPVGGATQTITVGAAASLYIGSVRTSKIARDAAYALSTCEACGQV